MVSSQGQWLQLCYTLFVDIEQFEQYITEAINMIPSHIQKAIENVAFLVEPGIPTGQLLGLYHGIPVTKRFKYSYSGVLPDTITIYQASIERQAGPDPESIRHLVHQVVHHEVGHYFGFSESQVRKWEQHRAQQKS